jgi:Uma2 family endonuclease
MPTAVTDPPLKTDPPRKRWSREEFQRIHGASPDRLELVNGELISKMGKKRPHVIALNLLRGWLETTFGLVFVNSEAPIDVSPEDNPTNEPEPDIIVLNRPQSTILQSNPGPADLVLVAEISDTTVGFDRTAKAALYARAGIQEYWILDLAGRRLIVHRQPEGGRYASVVAYGEGERVAPLAAPDQAVNISDVLASTV